MRPLVVVGTGVVHVAIEQAGNQAIEQTSEQADEQIQPGLPLIDSLVAPRFAYVHF